MGNAHVLGAGGVTSVNGQTGAVTVRIGGTNLYSRSTSIKDSFLAGKDMVETSIGYETSQYIPVEGGTEYVYQIWDITGETHLWRSIYWYDSEKTLKGQLAYGYAAEDQRYLIEIYTLNPTAAYLRVSQNDYLHARTKLEHGNFPTDWSPSPEDVEARLAAIEAKLDIAADQPALDGPEMEEPADHAGGVILPFDLASEGRWAA